MSSPGAISNVLNEISTIAQRQVLDTNPHFIPINLKVLDITLSRIIVQKVEDVYDADSIQQAKETFGDNWEAELAKDKVISLKELKQSIENYIKSKHKNRIEISGNSFTVNGSTNNSILNNLPAVVYSDGQIVGALYGSYNKAYSGLFKDFLNKEISKFIDKTIYKDTNYKIGFDVGHVLGSSDLLKTPLGEKLKNILNILSSLTDGNMEFPGVSSSYIANNKSAITDLKRKVDSIFDKLATSSSYGPKIEAEIKKDFGLNRLLVSLNANVVIIQDRKENQGLYANLIEGPLGQELINLLKDVNFSNNIVQQAVENIALNIAGKKVKVSKAKVSIKKTVANKTKKSKLVTKAEQNLLIKNPEKYKSAPTTSNLTALQNLLNASLVEQVKKNMGNGTRRDILNLQTGRFAESVEVTKLSESRQGMITAFYTYMKNPYATFSAGGRQEFPRSRDPKTLIAKSIREIAAQQVGNRLRSVLV